MIRHRRSDQRVIEPIVDRRPDYPSRRLDRQHTAEWPFFHGANRSDAAASPPGARSRDWRVDDGGLKELWLLCRPMLAELVVGGREDRGNLAGVAILDLPALQHEHELAVLQQADRWR